LIAGPAVRCLKVDRVQHRVVWAIVPVPAATEVAWAVLAKAVRFSLIH